MLTWAALTCTYSWASDHPITPLNDFLEKRVETLKQICIGTSVPGLSLISGGDDILTLANPKFAQKERIVRNFKTLDADYILLDLGAGTSFNTLDFFISTPVKIVVVTPFPTSVQNAYGLYLKVPSTGG